MAGIALALGRNLATAYFFAALLHSAGGRMFDVANNFEVVFDSPATVETLEFIDQLRPYMPRGATEYSFLQVVDSMVTGEAAMVFYWGRVYGRAAAEAPEIFKNIESFNHARHPAPATGSTGTTSRAGPYRSRTTRSSTKSSKRWPTIRPSVNG